MAKERPLYEDPDIRIESMPESPQEHLLYLLRNGEELNYILPRSCLKDFATTPRPGLESKMRNINYDMVRDALNRGLSVDSLGVAIAQAYIEKERRWNDEKSAMEV